jgi:hypothetical protein
MIFFDAKRSAKRSAVYYINQSLSVGQIAKLWRGKQIRIERTKDRSGREDERGVEGQGRG